MRCYLMGMEHEHELYGFVIAKNIKDAKSYFIRNNTGELKEWDEWFIRMRVKWAKKANIEGLKLYDDEGSIDAVDSIKRGIFSSCDYAKCPICKQEDKKIYELSDNTICCSDCEEGLSEKEEM